MHALAAVPPRDDVMRWAQELYDNAVDHKDATGFAAAFTPDAWLRFGNNEPVVGRDAIESAIAGFFMAFESLSHRAVGAYLVDDTLVLEAVVTYTRFDQQKVSVPAVTIFRLVGSDPARPTAPLADQCRIYVDLTPLFAPSA